MIGSVLKEARALKNLSQPEVANLVGVTKQTYLKWENNATEPKASQISKLAEVLDITADEICNGELKEKMSLDSFILNIAKIRPNTELIALRAWEQISDHKAFIHSLRMGEIEGYEDHEVFNVL
ncbi:helix-turn-helix domain-containing protein [Vibrio alginolyticus]|uniref:helix-turn-helix transcriptional regulator n=1 Tax=Vibrio TaxID=662 RepID=UPI001CDC78D8|nr:MULTISPECIES: helix-turn-helix transcriptional regulator [Vibrio]EIT7125799.1 helix-turn-helix transcriptional regulator [Vibrio parahaemolyticus]EIT7130682.1 helix-turn-helix transcriptional regulator [Vibrio parahaemolyticus]EIZ4250722.1 helix-turn-helix transcriptional regulator [Vibrio parahaemolyticus]EJE8526270.1 helix-turn-helix transcriptional regulator [Vibrio parahaemolyticus]MCA2450769.1 helix-turn-helix domain-containing protein [Vibrio alginolyticus]